MVSDRLSISVGGNTVIKRHQGQNKMLRRRLSSQRIQDSLALYRVLEAGKSTDRTCTAQTGHVTGTAQTGQAQHRQDRYSTDGTGIVQKGQAQHRPDRHRTEETSTAQTGQGRHRRDRNSAHRHSTDTAQAPHRHSTDRTGTAQTQHRRDRHSTDGTGTAQTGRAQHRRDRHSTDGISTAMIFATTLLLGRCEASWGEPERDMMVSVLLSDSVSSKCIDLKTL